MALHSYGSQEELVAQTVLDVFDRAISRMKTAFTLDDDDPILVQHKQRLEKLQLLQVRPMTVRAITMGTVARPILGAGAVGL